MQYTYYDAKLDGPVTKDSVTKKFLDNPPSPVQNTPMCMKNLRFVTAVIAAVGSLRSSPFSAFTITSKLRDEVNNGELSFIDKSSETVDGVGTYRVDHSEVRSVFRELLDNAVITGLKARQNPAGYLEYSNDTASVSPTQNQQPQPVPKPLAPTLPTFDTIFPPLPKGFAANAKFVAGNPDPNTCVGLPLDLKTALNQHYLDNEFAQKVQEYLNGRKGVPVTMKEIQSRFKGIYKTCKQYADIVAGLGLPVQGGDVPVSQKYVQI